MAFKNRWFVVICLAAVVYLSAALPASADVRDRVQEATAGFHDITLTCKVIKANHAELKKIGNDFQKSYDIKTTTIRYKSPDKIKVEGNVGIVHVAMVINGDGKSFKIPSLHYSHKENIKGQPHKRQNDVDLGILTTSLWRDYIVVSAESEKDAYKIVAVRSNAREKKIIFWADKDTMKLVKVEKLEANGMLKSKYIYAGHRKIDGIWVPTRIEVFNEDGKLAAITGYENIKVNTGIPDSEFKL